MRDGVDRGACDQRDPVAEVASHAAEQERAEECLLDECDHYRREKIFRYQRRSRFDDRRLPAADCECQSE